MRSSILPVAAFVVIAGTAIACQVPVFRYAFEQWNPEKYRVLILTNGETEKLKSVVSEMGFGENPSKQANAQMEVVRHGLTGLIAARPATFARAMVQLSDQARRARLGESGPESAKRFDHRELCQELEKQYLALLGLGPVPDPEPALRECPNFYAQGLKRAFGAFPPADWAWRARSTVSHYGRGWASRALKFWRWGR